ncbi:MAG: DUF3489 domain-containing protein [Maritimibacter sp.]|nr:DUF3489 domain-containing protein [Maritimibacter sp.]
MTSTDIQAADGGSETKEAHPKTTRAAQLRKMLSRKNGATIAQIQLAFSWKPHTVRAAISSLRKAGAVVERTDTPKGSVYRIVQQMAAQ